jgi:hypothetical protein
MGAVVGRAEAVAGQQTGHEQLCIDPGFADFARMHPLVPVVGELGRSGIWWVDCGVKCWVVQRRSEGVRMERGRKLGWIGLKK